MIRPFRSTVFLFASSLVLLGCSQQRTWLSQQLPETGPAGHGLAGVDSEHAQGVLAMARLSERRGQAEQAEHLYREVIERSPQTPLAYHRLGVMCAKQGRFDEAEACFSRAIALSPTDPELLSDAGYFYYLADKPSLAEEYLRRALQQSPNDRRASNNLAIVLGEQGRYEQSLAMFRRAGSESQAQTNIAYMYAQRGELDRAAAHWSRSLTLDAKMRPAAQALVQVAKYSPSQGEPARQPPDVDFPDVLADQRTPAQPAEVLSAVTAGRGSAGPGGARRGSPHPAAAPEAAGVPHSAAAPIPVAAPNLAAARAADRPQPDDPQRPEETATVRLVAGPPADESSTHILVQLAEEAGQPPQTDCTDCGFTFVSDDSKSEPAEPERLDTADPAPSEFTWPTNIGGTR
jgi:Flp pilus assembly protein TadD